MSFMGPTERLHAVTGVHSGWARENTVHRGHLGYHWSCSFPAPASPACIQSLNVVPLFRYGSLLPPLLPYNMTWLNCPAWMKVSLHYFLLTTVRCYISTSALQCGRSSVQSHTLPRRRGHGLAPQSLKCCCSPGGAGADPHSIFSLAAAQIPPPAAGLKDVRISPELGQTKAR